ncbi:MAG: transglutaminase family protein [Ilumatobacteraceae bacterium]
MGDGHTIETRRPARRGVARFLHDELLETLPAGYDRAALLDAERATYVISQSVTYTYDKPVRDLRQRLVLLPRRLHGDQRRVADHVSVTTSSDVGAAIHRRSDRFGNTMVRADVPRVKQRIEFRSRAVIVRDTLSSVDPPWRDEVPSSTALTVADAAITDAARSLGRIRDVWDTADAMSDMIRSAFEYAHDVTGVRTTAAEAWALRQGVCQDMAHVMIAMCASVGICSRYVSGHLVGDGASHAWVEVFDPKRDAVVAIDPTHRRRTDLRYITTATGRDYRDVAPTSGTYSGRGRGTLHVRKIIRLAEVA